MRTKWLISDFMESLDSSQNREHRGSEVITPWRDIGQIKESLYVPCENVLGSKGVSPFPLLRVLTPHRLQDGCLSLRSHLR